MRHAPIEIAEASLTADPEDGSPSGCEVAIAARFPLHDMGEPIEDSIKSMVIHVRAQQNPSSVIDRREFGMRTDRID